MEKQYRKFFLITIATQMLVCIVVLGILLLLSFKITFHNEEVLQQVALQDTESFMRQTIDNLFITIDNQRTVARKQALELVDLTEDYFRNMDEEHLLESSQLLLTHINRLAPGDPVHVIIKDTATGKSVLIEGEDAITLPAGDPELVAPFVAVSNSWVGDTISVQVFTTQDDIDLIAKQSVSEQLHATAFNMNSYIRVNEVLDYQGGDGYAVSVIQPNVTGMEGRLLSTNTQDGMGNYFYQTELDGITKDGEILHTYFFKNSLDGSIAEKLSYARLYEPFNWIVATSKPLYEIFQYTQEIQEYNERAVRTTIVICIGAMLLIFLLATSTIIITQRRYKKNIDIYVNDKTEFDMLTGSYSRSATVTRLEQRFSQFRKSGDSPLLIMLDLDDFKRINDTYGHDVGDSVLKQVSQVLQQTIREFGSVCRWGGEEFILICDSIAPAEQQELANTVLENLRKYVFKSIEALFSLTASMGGAYFKASDTCFEQAIKRADIALYRSKQLGKDCYTGSE